MEIEYYHTELEKELLINKIKENPTLKEIFKKQKNITRAVKEEIKHRRDGIIENWSVIHVRGATGSLKSSLALTLAQEDIDPTFTAKRIFHSYENFKTALNQSQPKECFMLDESIFTHGVGANRIIQDLQNLIETLRKRQNSLIIVSPTLKYFPEESFTYVIETIDNAIIATCPHNQKEHDPRRCTCYQNRTAKIKYAILRTAIIKDERYLGFYNIKIPWQTPIWAEYSLLKDDFMTKMRTNDLHNMDYKKIAQEIMHLPEFEHYKKSKMSIRLLIEQVRPNLTISESELITTQIRILQKMQESEELGEFA